MHFRKRSLNAIEWLERKMYTREDLSEGILHTILYWHNLLKRWNTSSGPSTGSSGLSNRWRIRRTWKCRALSQGKVVKWKIESIRQAKLFVRRQEAEMEVGVVVWMISDNLTTSTNFDQKVNYMNFTGGAKERQDLFVLRTTRTTAGYAVWWTGVQVVNFLPVLNRTISIFKSKSSSSDQKTLIQGGSATMQAIWPPGKAGWRGLSRNLEGGQLIPDEIPMILQRGLLLLPLPPLGLLHQLPHRRSYPRTYYSARAAQRPLEGIWGIHNSKFFVIVIYRQTNWQDDALLQIVKFFFVVFNIDVLFAIITTTLTINLLSRSEKKCWASRREHPPTSKFSGTLKGSSGLLCSSTHFCWHIPKYWTK